MAKLVRSTKLSIQAPFFYTKGQREVEAQHPVVGMDTGLAHTYMDFKLTSDRNYFKNLWFLTPSRHNVWPCLLYTSPSPRDPKTSRMPSSA